MGLRLKLELELMRNGDLGRKWGRRCGKYLFVLF